MPSPLSRPAGATRGSLVLQAVLRVLAPLVRMLVRQGVSYPALAQALKGVFVQAAHEELASKGMRITDSAVTLLSGVHRKDLREMASQGLDARRSLPVDAPLGVLGQVVALWLTGRGWITSDRRPKPLPRSGSRWSFDQLVAAVSKDVRPRAVLDEMLRLGVVKETGAGVALSEHGLAPRKGFDAMSEAMALNLHDHAACTVGNLLDGHNRLEQAVYVDEISEQSVAVLHREAREAWQAAFARVMTVAQSRFDLDARATDAAMRAHRFRFGVYTHDDVALGGVTLSPPKVDAASPRPRVPKRSTRTPTQEA